MANETKGIVPKQFLLAFVLVTLLFPLWGFANDVTNPMVKAFSRILQMSNFEGSLVQFAFYGGYFAMAFPAALFIKRYSYKAGILVGLALYAAGALLFIPGSMMMVFWPFLDNRSDKTRKPVRNRAILSVIVMVLIVILTILGEVA